MDHMTEVKRVFKDEYQNLVADIRFGSKIRRVPVKIIYKQKTLPPEETEFEEFLWVERGEDWYALIPLNNKKVLVVEGYKFRNSYGPNGEIDGVSVDEYEARNS